MAMKLRLTAEQERALTLLAEAQGVSRQEDTVRAIQDAAARYVTPERVADLSASGRERYAALLHRLAN
jgi:uncharacterized protein (DUF1778 family)